MWVCVIFREGWRKYEQRRRLGVRQGECSNEPPGIIGVPRGEDGGNEADVPGQEKGGWGKRHG